MCSIHVSSCVKINTFGNHSYQPKVVTDTSINVFINVQYLKKIIVELLISLFTELLKHIILYFSNNESFGIIIILKNDKAPYICDQPVYRPLHT